MDDILFLAHRLPYPPDRGDKIRSWNILKHLSGLATVHLGCFADNQAEASQLPAMREALGGRLGEAHVEPRSLPRMVAAARALARGEPVSLPLFSSAAMRRFAAGMLASGRVGAVYAFSGQMAQFVPERLHQRFVMDFVDMDSAKFEDYARDHGGPMGWVHEREAGKLFAFERATAARADVSLFVSEAEAGLFRRKASLPAADIRVLQNGVDLSFYDPSATFRRLAPFNGPLIAFTGQMDYRPNVDAVLGFAERSLPLLRKARPDLRFAIVGRNPADEVRRLQQRPGIIVTGAVDDIRSWLAAADIVVAPLRIARGVQNKVLEAMAMARPVVASPAAFEGIEAEPGRDLVVAEGALAHAQAVLALLDAPEQASGIGAAARARMEQAYAWPARLATLRQLLEQPGKQVAA